MSENRKLVSDLYEFANKGDFAKLAEMFAADQVVVQASVTSRRTARTA
jgi:ketosteroid isomerase-like protein